MHSIVVRTMACGFLLFLGAGHAQNADGGLGSGRADVGALESPADWKAPAYWGLKKGEYIPGPGCWTGSWGRKKYAYEICSRVTYCEEGKLCPTK